MKNWTRPHIPHILTRHGAATTLIDQEFRAMTGLRPDDLVLKRPEPSTRFLSHRLEMHTLERAMRLGDTGEAIIFEYPIGEGFRGVATPFGPHYFQTNQATIYFRNGLPYTGFPSVACIAKTGPVAMKVSAP